MGRHEAGPLHAGVHLCRLVSFLGQEDRVLGLTRSSACRAVRRPQAQEGIRRRGCMRRRRRKGGSPEGTRPPAGRRQHPPQTRCDPPAARRILPRKVPRSHASDRYRLNPFPDLPSPHCSLIEVVEMKLDTICCDVDHARRGLDLRRCLHCSWSRNPSKRQTRSMSRAPRTGRARNSPGRRQTPARGGRRLHGRRRRSRRRSSRLRRSRNSSSGRGGIRATSALAASCTRRRWRLWPPTSKPSGPPPGRVSPISCGLATTHPPPTTQTPSPALYIILALATGESGAYPTLELQAQSMLSVF